MRTKNSFYNTIAQMIYYIINIAFGMINRKILLAVMGVEYQGINGLFSNVLSLLSFLVWLVCFWEPHVVIFASMRILFLS